MFSQVLRMNCFSSPKKDGSVEIPPLQNREGCSSNWPVRHLLPSSSNVPLMDSVVEQSTLPSTEQEAVHLTR
jgi:hypothetical protein